MSKTMLLLLLMLMVMMIPPGFAGRGVASPVGKAFVSVNNKSARRAE